MAKGKQNLELAVTNEKTAALAQRKYPSKGTVFYRKVLDKTEQMEFAAATEVDGIDAEIAILRIKVKSLLEDDPDNLKLIVALTNALGRLIRTRYNINKEKKNGFKEAAERVVKEVLIPLGMNILGKKL